MLITSANNETLAARAGFLLAEIDYLSAKCLPVSPTRGHSSLSEATGEIITAHFMKIINDESSLQEHSECATRRAHQGLIVTIYIFDDDFYIQLYSGLKTILDIVRMLVLHFFNSRQSTWCIS